MKYKMLKLIGWIKMDGENHNGGVFVFRVKIVTPFNTLE